MTDAPYPADVRAKGWRFELDHERIRQSDTWALAAPELRPWLLMLWMVAWEQTPCGSLPANDELITARIGMPLSSFVEHKRVLLRGWKQAGDGRLYHPTLTERVVEMIERRRKEAERRGRNRAVNRGTPGNVPRDTVGTPTGGTVPEPVGSVSKDTGAAAPPVHISDDPVKQMFDRGVALIGGDGKSARSLIGKLRRQYSDVAVLDAIVAGEAERPSDPIPWLTRACATRAGPPNGGAASFPVMTSFD